MFFGHCVIVSFWQFFENYTGCQYICDSYFHGDVLTKIVLGYILGDFFSQTRLVTLVVILFQRHYLIHEEAKPFKCQVIHVFNTF
jgi:hypothetical protein